MAVEQIATARSGTETQTFPTFPYSPISQVIGLHVLRPGELAEYDLVLAFDYFLLIDIILPQQTQRVRHGRKTPVKLSKTTNRYALSFHPTGTSAGCSNWLQGRFHGAGIKNDSSDCDRSSQHRISNTQIIRMKKLSKCLIRKCKNTFQERWKIIIQCYCGGNCYSTSKTILIGVFRG